MKTSELIKTLTRLQDIYGDKDITFLCSTNEWTASFKLVNANMEVEYNRNFDNIFIYLKRKKNENNNR